MDFAQAIFDFIANPNVAYVLLVLGLVSLVVAFTAPGTGFAEAAAALCLILALVGLSQLPVNIAGVLLILLGIGLFLADIKLQSGFVAIGGALMLGLGSLFLFRPDEQAVTVSWWLIALTTLGTAGFFGFGLNRALRAHRLPARVGADQLVGERGVIKTLALESNRLTGTAQVGSELWTVKADEPLAEGEEVIVEEAEGVVLKVRARTRRE
jgi:membrane-bound serine protease (ClpP class)